MWELGHVRWLAREGDVVAMPPGVATCAGCARQSAAGVTVCCGLPICMGCVYGSRPMICPLCAEQFT